MADPITITIGLVFSAVKVAAGVGTSEHSPAQTSGVGGPAKIQTPNKQGFN
jgi:hypothetical protein